jgi:hypothetical protein
MSSPITGGSQNSLQELQEDRKSTIRQPSFDLSDHDNSDTEHDEHPGDYSARMEELFEDGEDDAPDFREQGEDEDDDEDGFLYTGVDAGDLHAGYQARLRDVLGSELSDDDEWEEAPGVKRASIIDGASKMHFNGDEPLVSFSPTACTSCVALNTRLYPRSIEMFFQTVVPRRRR